MIRKVFLAALVAALGFVGAVTGGAAAELRAITLSAGADSAQLTLDLHDVRESAPEALTRKLFTLDHPDRVVIDLPHTHLASGVRAPGASGGLDGVRLGGPP